MSSGGVGGDGDGLCSSRGQGGRTSDEDDCRGDEGCLRVDWAGAAGALLRGHNGDCAESIICCDDVREEGRGLDGHESRRCDDAGQVLGCAGCRVRVRLSLGEGGRRRGSWGREPGEQVYVRDGERHVSRGRDGCLGDGESHDARDIGRGERAGAGGINAGGKQVLVYCVFVLCLLAIQWPYLDAMPRGADSLLGSSAAEAVTVRKTSEAVSWQTAVEFVKPLRLRLQVSLPVKVLVVQTGMLLAIVVVDDISSAQGDEETRPE